MLPKNIHFTPHGIIELQHLAVHLAHGAAALEAQAAQLSPAHAPHILEFLNFNIDAFGNTQHGIFKKRKMLLQL